MKKISIILSATLVLAIVASSCSNSSKMKMDKMESSVMVGGAAMYPTKNIIENAVNSNDHKTLVAAVKAAGLVETLSSAGPFTVFAPTDAAFAALPAGVIPFLLKPENKPELSKILTYHVIAGKYSSKDIAKMISKNGGKASFKTVEGTMLSASKKGDSIVLTDALGNMSTVTIADVYQSNGIIHVVDAVVLPRAPKM